MWSVAIHDTQTGNLILDYTTGVSGGSWGRGDVTQRSHTFPLRGDGLDRAARRYAFRKWDSTLVHLWDGVPVYAGLITDTTYDKASGVLTVSHADVRLITRKRMMFGIGAYNPAGQVVCAGLSLRGIVRRMVHIGMVLPYSEAWPLPINLPTEETGSVPTRTYYHYEFQTIDKILTDIEGEENGPDIEFQPVYDSNGRLSWDLLIGNPYLTGPTFEAHLTGDAQPTDVTVVENGQEQTTGVFALGKGSEQDMRVGQAALPVSAGLSKDVVVAHKDIDHGGHLFALAQGDLAATKSPTIQWTAKVRTAEVNPATLRIGSTLRTFSQDDEWIEDGWNTHRVIGFSGDYTNTISLTLEVA